MLAQSSLSGPKSFLHRLTLIAERNQLLRNMGWIASAEMVSRIGRIVAAIILARTLDAYAFGIAALALTVFELVRLFCENGIGASVVRAADKDLDATANTAHQLMWIICLALAGIQAGIGLVTATVFGAAELGAMIAVLSGVYLIMPFGVVHGFVLQREERFRHLAAVTATQTTSDHILTALLALSGFGAWAIVLPKLLTAPIWLIGIRRGRPWERNDAAGTLPATSILQFALPVLGAEIASACRDHADKMIVSAFLGIEALGVYYFAFNAGLGLSSSLNRAINGALYPHLCKSRSLGENIGKKFDRLFQKSAAALGGIYLLQAGAALFYVPILFGRDWAAAAPLVAIFCLSGPARLAVDAARALSRAEGRSGREMAIAGGFATITLIGLGLNVESGLQQAISAMTVSCFIGAALGLVVARCNSPKTNSETQLKGKVS